ncbi:hypothetical protein KVY11_14505 [Acinetobacter sp. CWB-G5]|uniref:hypothetical protein n=1 Tax=Acinetobacter sp. CWB-G5 TaxID=2855444 RepID=UPI001C473878|nr:hypothetical protein [Acinetobacter sp. CWB-G5]MBV7309875.1 hypothetical protein [Acinetobacter sp. CWB-G5]
MFVDGSRERIFINTALGCDSKCKFCYLPSQSFPIGNRPRLSISFDQAIKELINHPQFITGKFGTILSIGCYSECWSRHNKSTTIELIKSLMTLGNPIQLATKRIISKEELIQLNKDIIWKGQLTIFISSTTISEYKIWEKSTSDPYKRFSIFKESRQTRIPVCLYLKPILPNITIKDIEIYAKYIKMHKIQTIVGSMFIYDHKLIDHKKAPIPSEDLFAVESNDEKTIFNKLFELHLGTYHNSIEAIEFWRSLQMADHLISTIKSNLYLLEDNKTLQDYISKSEDPQKVILDLLKIYGYVDIDFIENPNFFEYKFKIGDSTSELITLFVHPEISLDGSALQPLQQTYQLVRLIETNLKDALYYPQDLRNKIIKDNLEQLNINEDLYKRVLSNWFN